MSKVLSRNKVQNSLFMFSLHPLDQVRYLSRKQTSGLTVYLHRLPSNIILGDIIPAYSLFLFLPVSIYFSAPFLICPFFFVSPRAPCYGWKPRSIEHPNLDLRIVVHTPLPLLQLHGNRRREESQRGQLGF